MSTIVTYHVRSNQWRRGNYVAPPEADRTDELNALIAATPDGTEGNRNTVTLPDERWRVDGKIVVTNRNHLNITSSGTFTIWTEFTGVELGIVTQQGASNRSHWTLTSCEDVHLSNMQIDGPYENRRYGPDPRFAAYNEATAFEHGYSVQGASQECSVQNCSFYNIGGDGLYVGGTGEYNQNITLKNCTGAFPGRQSLGIVLVDNLLVEDVNIQWGGRSGLDIEPNHDSHFVHNATFRRCDIGSQFYPFIVGGEPPLRGGETKPGILNKRENILIEDCIGRNAASSHTAILANRTGINLTVRNHTDLRQRSKYGVTLAGWEGPVIIENSIITSGPATPTTYGVWVKNCTGTVDITGNTFNGVTGDGGADELMLVEGGSPVITSSGNEWSMGTQTD